MGDLHARTYACNAVIPVPVLYQPIDSKYINTYTQGMSCQTGKTMSTRNISGLLLCCKKKANQVWEIKLQARMLISL